MSSGILRCYPVVEQDSFCLSPIENAIEVMNTKNQELKDLIKRYIASPNLELKPFTMKVHGIVDAAVQGGVSVYEKVGFNNTIKFITNHVLFRM